MSWGQGGVTAHTRGMWGKEGPSLGVLSPIPGCLTTDVLVGWAAWMLLHTCFWGFLGTCQPHSRRNPLTLEQGSLPSGCTLPRAPGQVSEHCQPRCCSSEAADLGTGDQKPQGPPACPSWSQWGENAGAGGEIPTEGLGCKVGQQGGCPLWDTRALAAPSASTGVNWAAPLLWGTQCCSLEPQNVALQSCWVAEAGRGQDAGPHSCCHEETWDPHSIPAPQGWAPQVPLPSLALHQEDTAQFSPLGWQSPVAPASS